MMDRLDRSWLPAVVGLLPAVRGPERGRCSPSARDAPVEQYDLYVRDDDTAQMIFHSGFNAGRSSPASSRATSPRTRSRSRSSCRAAGKFTLLLVGVIGDVDGRQAGAGRDAAVLGRRELNVERRPTTSTRSCSRCRRGDDTDGDSVARRAPTSSRTCPRRPTLYAGHTDLLDCDDKIDIPGRRRRQADQAHGRGRSTRSPPRSAATAIDENCNGNADEACVDKDKRPRLPRPRLRRQRSRRATTRPTSIRSPIRPTAAATASARWAPPTAHRLLARHGDPAASPRLHARQDAVPDAALRRRHRRELPRVATTGTTPPASSTTTATAIRRRRRATTATTTIPTVHPGARRVVRRRPRI